MKRKFRNLLVWTIGLIAISGISNLMASPITVIDLSGGPPANGTANGGLFYAADPQPTGTGVIDPFLREQNDGSEQGINTSISSPPYDDKSGPWTHDLSVSQLTPTVLNGISYYKFLLDANQEGNKPISMINFEIFVTQGAPLMTSAGLMNLVNNGTAAYNMNGGSTQYRIDITSQNGSGSGDMYAFVPVSDIGTSGNLYLYAQFGVDANGNGYASNDGFEEWNSVEVPEGGTTIGLLGMALLGLGMAHRMVRAKA